MSDQMVSQSEIKDHIARYLNGDESLAQFQEWFVPLVWEIDDETAVGRLAAEIELRLAEYTSGHLPESQLRDEFKVLLLAMQHPMIEFRVTTATQGYVISTDTGLHPRPQELKIRVG